jgi:hypothetical protein
VLPNVALGGTFWIDNTKPAGGDGTDELPFNTLAAGIAAIAALATPVGTLLIAGRPDYTGEGVLLVPDAITVAFNGWRSPSQQPISFSLSAAGVSPLIYLRGCNVELTLGDAIVQADMSDIVAVSSGGESSLVMRGGSARLTSQACRLSGSWDDAACSLMHVGGSEAVLDCTSLRCDGCDVEGTSLTAATLEFRTTSFASPMVLDATTIRMDRQSERSAALAGALPTSLPVPLEPINPIYGTGATGSVTLNAGSVLLNPLDEYDNLTLDGTGAVRCENSILRVRNLLNLATAGALAIRDYTGGGGANGAANVGGGAWGGSGGATQGNTGTLQAPSGPNGGSGNGVAATVAPTLQNAFGGKGGASNKGGDRAPNTGGPGNAAATVTNARVTPHWPITFVGPASNATGGSVVTPPLPIMGGMVGQAGSSGAGDGGTGTGGGGGGAGRGGGSVVVYARGIELAAGTAAGCISAAGQSGGKGGNGVSDAGGGSGGGGGGGGFVLIASDWIIGAQPAADEVSASGGAGGGGGTGPTSGDGGSGGNGGDGGQIVFWNLLTNTRTIVTGAAGSAGTIPAGSSAGGVGGAGGACTADFP